WFFGFRLRFSSVVGNVPTRAFKLKCCLRNQFGKFSLTRRTGLQGLVGKLLNDLKLFATFLTTILINRHPRMPSHWNSRTSLRSVNLATLTNKLKSFLFKLLCQ